MRRKWYLRPSGQVDQWPADDRVPSWAVAATQELPVVEPREAPLLTMAGVWRANVGRSR